MDQNKKKYEGKKRGPKFWRFDIKIAYYIYERIVEGGALEKICNEKGLPGRWIISRWRREVPEFNKAIAEAREFRSIFCIDYIDDILNSPSLILKKRIPVHIKRQIGRLKWLSYYKDRGTFGKSWKNVVIDTGITKVVWKYRV